MPRSQLSGETERHSGASLKRMFPNVLSSPAARHCMDTTPILVDAKRQSLPSPPPQLFQGREEVK